MTSANSSVRFLCFGVGAIGTYIGGSLAQAGFQVVFVEHPSVAEKIKREGLHLGLISGKVDIPNPVVAGSLEEAFAQGPFDAGMLAIKSFDTASFVDSLVGHLPSVPPILCLQNGVENEPLLASKLGAGNVIAGTVTSAIGRRGIGSIEVERLRGIGISMTHPLSIALIQAFSQAGLNAKGYANPDSMKWSKMLTNLLANASSAILDMPPTQIFSHPGLFRMELAMIKEALDVMDALKIPVTDLPGTPVRLLVMAIKSLPLSLSRILLVRSLGKGRGAKMPSFHIDLYSGNPKSEVNFLNGAVVRAGERLQIPTPINLWLTKTLMELVDGKLSLRTFAGNPDLLLSNLRETVKE